MPKYLVTYHASDMPNEPEATAAARAEFTEWAGKTGSALVEPGAPIESRTTVSTSRTEESVVEEPFSGWSIIEADDVEAAGEILSDHPFLSRGGVLQIHEPVES